MKKLFGVVVAMAMTATGLGQSGAQHYSAAELEARAAKLAKSNGLKTSGAATEKLETYTNDATMLTLRTESGGAELHAGFADIFFVVEGTATLTTGGRVVDPKQVSPGETRGTRVEGGREQKLGKGDVVHISPNTPHQLTIAKGGRFTYFVVKVKE